VCESLDVCEEDCGGKVVCVSVLLLQVGEHVGGPGAVLGHDLVSV
jgi:hypothetical protein